MAPFLIFKIAKSFASFTSDNWDTGPQDLIQKKYEKSIEDLNSGWIFTFGAGSEFFIDAQFSIFFTAELSYSYDSGKAVYRQYDPYSYNNFYLETDLNKSNLQKRVTFGFNMYF